MFPQEMIASREIHVARFRSRKGDFLLLHLVCPRTGDVTLVPWRDAQEPLREAALMKGIDPLHLLDRCCVNDGVLAQITD